MEENGSLQTTIFGRVFEFIPPDTAGRDCVPCRDFLSERRDVYLGDDGHGLLSNGPSGIYSKYAVKTPGYGDWTFVYAVIPPSPDFKRIGIEVIGGILVMGISKEVLGRLYPDECERVGREFSAAVRKAWEHAQNR